MAAVINTNIQSLNAQRNLSTSQGALATSMQRLSSGLRINSAKDDAAGLAISDRMTTQVRGLTVAARNANDGISLAQTAEGALSSVTNNLQRIRELAIQARNATNSAEDRAALNAEVQQLKAEITRIAEQTSFNGTKLLDGSFTNMAFQVGANQGQTIDINEVVNSNIDALGAWQSVAVAGKIDGEDVKPGGSTANVPGVINLTPIMASGSTVNLVAGAGTATTEISLGSWSGGPAGLASALNAAFSAAGFSAASNSMAAKEVNGSIQIVSSNDAPVKLTLPFDSPFGAQEVSAPAKQSAVQGALPALEFKLNGVDIELNAAATPADRLKDMVAVINGAKIDPKVTASIVNGSISLSAKRGDVKIEDGGAAPNDAAGIFAGAGLRVGTTTEGADKIPGSRAYEPEVQKSGFADLNVLDADFADNAILAMDAALTSVNDARARLGAVQNRFETTIENLNISNENLTASRSRILDADFAAETAALSRAQILQQAGTAMVAQANQVPQQVLQLLQG